MAPVASTELIVPPDPKTLLSDTRNLIVESESIEVKDIVQHERAEKLIVALKRTVKVLHEGDKADGGSFPGLDLSCDLTHKAWKAATSLRAASIDPYENAIKAVTQKSNQYVREAEARAEDERRKKEAEAKKLEEDRKLADAAVAETPAEAEAILNEPVNVPAVHVAPQVAKVSGIQMRDNWKADGHDLMATVKFVAAHPEYSYLLTYSATGLTSVARSQKSAAKIPGIRVWNDPVRATRSA
jgi:hypothetical protein